MRPSASSQRSLIATRKVLPGQTLWPLLQLTCLKDVRRVKHSMALI